MSTYSSDSNIEQVGEIQASSGNSTIGPACRAMGVGIAAAIGVVTEELFTGDVSISTRKFQVNNPSLLYSTPICHKEFYDLLSQNNSFTSSKYSDTLMSKKAALIKTLDQSSYKISNSTMIVEKIEMAADSKDIQSFNKNVKNLIAEIETEHTSIVKNELTSKVREASLEMGFNSIRIIERESSATIIVAENEKGQALVNEIKVNKNNFSIDHEYETVGISDNSCQEVIKQFQKSLKSRGVIAAQNKKKWTGGIPLLNSGKVVNRSRNKNQQKERARRLNRNNQTVGRQ